MGIIREIRRNWKNPVWWRDRILHRIIYPTIFKEDGMSIFEEDWDNLIILDACRYDVFSRVIKEYNIKGRLKFRLSKGSDTTEFLLKNFNKKYDDIVYVTANPFVDKFLKDRFHKIISVWNFGWDERHQTVLPQTMYYYTLKTMLKYRDKRLIVHFIQPHYPYLVYRVYDSSLKELRSIVLGNIDKNIPRKYKDSLFKIYGMDIYAMIDETTHRSVYSINLRIVLHYVERLVKFLRGKTVITADHGEAFGERLHPLIPIRIYGHPPGVRIPVLVKVPWFIVDEIKEELDVKELKKEINRVKPIKTEKMVLKEQINRLKVAGKI